jgi:hypothetical protein
VIARLRVATWNLARPGSAGVRAERLRSHMAGVDADVWVLTETHLAFSPGPKFRLAATSSIAPDLKADERWTGIWLRNGIDCASVITRDAERTACIRVVSKDDPPAFVYGTVLPWLNDVRRAPLKGARRTGSRSGGESRTPVSASLATSIRIWRQRLTTTVRKSAEQPSRPPWRARD